MNRSIMSDGFVIISHLSCCLCASPRRPHRPQVRSSFHFHKSQLTTFDFVVSSDLLSTTVMFADLVGFTAWSSVREPAHVFTLLETIYSAFDKIAKRRRVFKVETVGDCYVAVAGLPEPRRDHAVVMARFSHECLYVSHHFGSLHSHSAPPSVSHDCPAGSRCKLSQRSLK